MKLEEIAQYLVEHIVWNLCTAIVVYLAEFPGDCVVDLSGATPVGESFADRGIPAS